jgi:hypothetical protein
MDKQGSCPLTVNQILQEYFIENRTRILEISAFLDRLQRASDAGTFSADFRLDAFHRALRILASNETDKIGQIQLVFSDPTTEPRPVLDSKSAAGAWNPATQVR